MTTLRVRNVRAGPDEAPLMRFRARRAVARAGAFAALGSRAVPWLGRRVVALCYHSIDRSSFATADPALFEEHLAWLGETCEIVPFRALLDAAAQDGARRPAVAVTFDDGYADNHEVVLPLLQKYRIPATVFLTAGLVDGDPKVRTRFQQLRGAEVDALAWGQVRELVAAGVEIGAHTYSHPNLIRLGQRAVADEVSRSKELIEDRLDAVIDLFAYPFGKPGRHFDATTVQAVRDAGYHYAASVLYRAVRPSDSPFAIPRFFAARDSVNDLASKVGGDWDWVGRTQERLPVRLARIVSPQDFRW